jgi:hypothetical protein
VGGVREAALSECVRLKKIAELVVNRGNRSREPDKEDEPKKNGEYEGGDNDGPLVTADPAECVFEFREKKLGSAIDSEKEEDEENEGPECDLQINRVHQFADWAQEGAHSDSS